VYSITAATGVILDLDPGGMRKLHRHPNADGWQYVIDAQVAFFYAEFSGGKVDFGDAEFSGGKVSFTGAKFSGAEVAFFGAQFSGGKVDFSDPGDWSHPPLGFDESGPPPGVTLPAAARSSPGTPPPPG